MSLADILVNAIVSYKGDTSDLKQQVKDLQGVQRDMAQQELENSNARNKQLQDWADQLGDCASALGKLKAAGDFVWEGMKLKQQELRLETAALGVDIDRLSASFGGLKTNMEVLQFAAKANQSEFKLTNDQLNMVAQATRTLTERGFDAATVQDAFTNAIVTGRVKGLLPYGFQLGDLSGSIDLMTDKLSPLEKAQSRVNQVMGFAGTLAKDAGTGVGTFGEDADRAAVNLKNAWTSMKESLGGLADQLIPLVEHLAKAAQLIGDIASLADKLPGGGASKPQADRDWTDTASSLGKSLFNPSDLLDVYGDARSAVTGDGGPQGNGAFLAGQIRDAKIKADQAMTIAMSQLKESEKSFFGSYVDGAKSTLLTGYKDTGKALDQMTSEMISEAKRQRAAAAAREKQIQEEIKKMVGKELTESGDNLLDKLNATSGVTLGGIDTTKLNAAWAPPSAYQQQLQVNAAAAAAAAAVWADKNLIEQLTRDNPAGYSDADRARKASLQSPTQLVGGDGYSNATSMLGALATPSEANGLAAAFKNIDSAWTKLQQDIASDADAEARTARQTVLEKTFGKVDEIHLYSKAFEGLTKASTSALNAWISGSESASQAFKKAVGGSVEALADQMLIEGLKNEAYAIGSLVPGPAFDPAAAAGYAATGAEFLAGSAVAAVLARELGAGSTPTPSKGSAAGAGGAAQTNPTAPNSAANGGTTIVYGDAFAADSPRMRAVKAKKLVALATGTTSGTVSS